MKNSSFIMEIVHGDPKFFGHSAQNSIFLVVHVYCSDD